MQITSSNVKKLKNGVIKGTIRVKDGRRRYLVRFEREQSGHAEQWGAPTEVLCRTYSKFEELCQVN